MTPPCHEVERLSFGIWITPAVSASFTLHPRTRFISSFNMPPE